MYKTHGFTSKSKIQRIYKIWDNMRDRCRNPNSINWKYYGEKGVVILWSSFEEFRDDMYESYLEHVKEFGEMNTSIDRINNDENYCMENCKWSTRKEQARNRKPRISYTIEKICKACKKTFRVRRYRRDSAKFCSRDCVCVRKHKSISLKDAP